MRHTGAISADQRANYLNAMFELSLCTGVLSLFIALPLIVNWRNRPANLWLGLFIFSIGWLSLQVLYFAFPKALFGVFDPPVAAIGAFFYLYVRSLTGLGNHRRQFWHFIPLALWSGGLLAARVAVPPMTLYSGIVGDGWNIFDLFLLGFQLLAVGYAIAVLWRLRQYRAVLRDSYSSLKERDLIWLRNLTTVVIGMLVIWIPATILGGRVGTAALVCGRLVTLFLLGWYGMGQHAVLLPQLSEAAQSVAAENGAINPPPTELAVTAAALESKYARSGMSDATQKAIGERLLRRIGQHRDYLDSDIKLTDIADQIGTSPQLLSQYLNQVLGINFFDYVNGLRVAEVKQLIADPAHADTPLLDLAFAAGFNSKSTFNASFKKITGTAPSIWRNLPAKTSEPNG